MTRPIRFSIQASVVTDPAGFRDLAVKAEDLGYAAISMADHIADGQLAPMVALMAAADAMRSLGWTTVMPCSSRSRIPACR